MGPSILPSDFMSVDSLPGSSLRPVVLLRLPSAHHHLSLHFQTLGAASLMSPQVCPSHLYRVVRLQCRSDPAVRCVKPFAVPCLPAPMVSLSRCLQRFLKGWVTGHWLISVNLGFFLQTSASTLTPKVSRLISLQPRGLGCRSWGWEFLG